MQEPRAPFRQSMVDSFLFAAFVALLFAILLSMASDPNRWRWCLDILDVRDWRHWEWTGVGTALLGVLLLIRVWPEKKR